MDRSALRTIWKREEDQAHIHGWDFSHIRGRYEEEHDLPWDYPALVRRYLRPEARLLDYDTGGGEFLTEQVGGDNDRDLVERVLPGTEKPYPHLYLSRQRRKFEEAGFRILQAEEAYRPILFYDVGAFVWFARIIEWEFPGFSVDRCFDALCALQEEVEREGRIQGTIHRYLIAAQK